MDCEGEQAEAPVGRLESAYNCGCAVVRGRAKDHWEVQPDRFCPRRVDIPPGDLAGDAERDAVEVHHGDGVDVATVEVGGQLVVGLFGAHLDVAAEARHGVEGGTGEGS